LHWTSIFPDEIYTLLSAHTLMLPPSHLNMGFSISTENAVREMKGNKARITTTLQITVFMTVLLYRYSMRYLVPMPLCSKKLVRTEFPRRASFQQPPAAPSQPRAGWRATQLLPPPGC